MQKVLKELVGIMQEDLLMNRKAEELESSAIKANREKQVENLDHAAKKGRIRYRAGAPKAQRRDRQDQCAQRGCLGGEKLASGVLQPL